MLSDSRKVAIAKANLRRQYTGASQSVGPLIADKFYQIRTFKSGDDFSNVGTPTVGWGCSPGSNPTKGRDGIIFQATGTTPTVWTNASVLVELRVADLRALASDTFSAASSDPIIVTSTSFEGGSAGGQVAFEPSILSEAIESLLAEWDPDYIVDRAIPRRTAGFTVLTD